LPAEPTLDALSGGGRLTVTVENEDRSSRYQGVVPLVGERFAACFEAYFERSEQLPTRLWLHAGPDGVSGLLLQRLPSGSSASAEEIEHAASMGDEDWGRVVALAETVTPEELATLPVEQLLWRLFNEEQVRLFDAAPVYFQCTCSRERVNGILRSLGEDEVNDILAEQGRVEVVCEFCNRAWRYDPVDVGVVFAPGDTPTGSRVLQ
jgi:molecular chaperone Hsp33